MGCVVSGRDGEADLGNVVEAYMFDALLENCVLDSPGSRESPSLSLVCLTRVLPKLVLVLLVSWDTSGTPEEKPTSQSRFEIIWKVTTCKYFG